MDLTDIHRKFCPTAAEYIFFLSSYRSLFRVDHMLSHKMSLRKYKKIEIIPSIFSDHNGMKLEINQRKTGKFTNTWKLSQTLLNKQQNKERERARERGKKHTLPKLGKILQKLK